MKIKLILIVLVLFLSCSKDSNNQIINSDKEFTIINNGSLFGNGSEGLVTSNLVIDNTVDWQNLITQMDSHSNVSSNFSEINIDFENFIVLAKFLEVKQNGYELEISNISETEDSLLVSSTGTPLITSVINQPYAIIKIPKTSKQIIFN